MQLDITIVFCRSTSFFSLSCKLLLIESLGIYSNDDFSNCFLILYLISFDKIIRICKYIIYI